MDCGWKNVSKQFVAVVNYLVSFLSVQLMNSSSCSGHKNWVLCIAWSPDGKHLVSGSKAGELQCWDPLTGQPSGNPLVV